MNASADYDRMARAIEFIVSNADRQPQLREIAAHIHLSEYHFQRLFSRWVGVSPKRFLQVLTVERAKRLLREAKPLLEVTDTLGLSSGSRLHDHFVAIEAVTPGEFGSQGSGLRIRCAVHVTPFGPAFVAMTSRGVCRLSFLDEHDFDWHCKELAAAFPGAHIVRDKHGTKAIVSAIDGISSRSSEPITLHVMGTNFQIKVWQALLNIPEAQLRSYSHVAESLGAPKAVRAVASAIAANPVALLIPCHRVIRQSGEIGGYHWGVTRKRVIQAWELARAEGKNTQ